MATQAAWYEEADVRGGAETGIEAVEQEPFRLRAVPNEDICLWIAPIDNSRVVRQADPETWGACWRFITAASVAVVLVVGLLLPGAYGVMAGYKIHKLEQERVELQQQQRLLEMEESRLLSPARLQELADMQELADPAPQQVYYLDPGPDQSLAYQSVQH